MLQTKSHLPFIYNPAELTKSELIENFVVRNYEFEQIFNIIKNDDMKNPPQHIIIQGQRGTGKTTLLLRLSYAIKDDKELNKWLVPVVSDEESWGISTLTEFWKHTAEDLEEINDDFIGITREMEKHEDDENLEEKSFEVLQNKLSFNKKKIILFIDNFGDLVKKFNKKEQQRLREILLTSPNLRIVAASSVVLEFTYKYSEPFYEFFKVFSLQSLKKKETDNLLLKLGEGYKTKKIKEIIKNNPQRVETLRRITGGVPRTIVLLYEILIDNDTGNAFRDLEQILDRVTPQYKHRMDALKPISQKIVNVLALNWDAMPVKDISGQTKIASKQVSAQLQYLEKNGIVTKERTSTKNHIYYLSERFFNIWYLIRRGREKHKNMVRFLVQFLELWCTPKQLLKTVFELKEAIHKGTVHEKHTLYMTEALDYIPLEQFEQYSLIAGTKNYLECPEGEQVNELSHFDIGIYNKVIELLKKGDEKKAVLMVTEIKNKIYEDNFLIGNIYFYGVKNNKKAEEYYKKAIKKGNYRAMNNLAILLFERKLRKEKALELARKSTIIKKYLANLHTLLMVLLWNDEIEESIKIWKSEFYKEEYINKWIKEISEIFNFFIAKKQYNFIYKLFSENKFEIKERYKPIYFALLHFMSGKYETERKKMGPELKETVDEIITAIKQMGKDYS